MRRIPALIILSLFPCFAFAQFEYFNSAQFWNKLELQRVNSKADISPDDTAIIVASNRVMDTTSFRYLPEERDGKHIRYFVVYSGGDKWHVLPVYSLEHAVRLIPHRNKDWVVYTEGMGKFFTSGVDRAMNMASQYDLNVILLDYPSITAHRKRLGNYFFARKNAAIAYKDFLPVLDTIRQMQEARQLGTSGINLFFHSMGNIVMRQIIRKGRLDRLNDSRWVNNLVFNAPCIPQRGHRKLIDQVNFARHIYVHYNPHDFTLGGAYFLSKRHQLGMKVKKPVSAKAIYINFNTLVDKGHSNFLNLYGRNTIPEAASRHYHVLLHGDTVSVHDIRHYKPTTYKGIGYDILP